MPSFATSAPGKIILFGEHAVVYGQPAIAVPVTQVKAKAIVSPNIRGEPGTCHIYAPMIGLDHYLDSLPKDDPIASAIRSTLEVMGITLPPAFNLRVTSEIPVAAGLGSGAAVSVAIIRAISAFLGGTLPDDVVNKLTFEVEKFFHGTPSGIDNTVITYAQPVYFTKNQPIEILEVRKPFSIVIADSGVSSPTKITVGEVRKKWEKDKKKFEAIFSEIGAIAREARYIIENDNAEKLGGLMIANQEYLEMLGVSSPILQNLLNVAQRAGAIGAKLSGGGRGGNIIALGSPSHVSSISRDLLAAGAVRTIITKID